MCRFLIAATLILSLPVPALAQQVGIRGGVSSAPTFVFGGLRVESTSNRPRPVTVRGTLDFAGGSRAATLLTIAANAWPTLPGSSWSPYIGVGPTLVVARGRDGTRPQGGYVGSGLGFIVGVERRRRWSVEAQVNIKRDLAPRIYAAVGYRLR